MRRVVAILAVLLTACGSDAIDEVPSRESAAPPVSIEAVALPKMSSVSTQVGADAIANEVVHPDALRPVLAQAGFSSGMQRSFQGGTGAFTRVQARSLAFESEEGIDVYLDWFSTHAGEEIITAKRIEPEVFPPAQSCSNISRTGVATTTSPSTWPPGHEVRRCCPCTSEGSAPIPKRSWNS